MGMASCRNAATGFESVDYSVAFGTVPPQLPRFLVSRGQVQFLAALVKKRGGLCGSGVQLSIQQLPCNLQYETDLGLPGPLQEGTAT